MKRIKVLISILLTMLLLIALQSATIAESREKELHDRSHTHTLVLDRYIYSYLKIDSIHHWKYITPVYKCSYPGCNYVESGDTTSILQTHSKSTGYSYYTGNNYHSGNYHYCEYARGCVCGFVFYDGDTQWRSYICPGNGNCILPQKITPILVDR